MQANFCEITLNWKPHAIIPSAELHYSYDFYKATNIYAYSEIFIGVCSLNFVPALLMVPMFLSNLSLYSIVGLVKAALSLIFRTGNIINTLDSPILLLI